jgi:ABC-2 type transport system permease protein
MSALQPFRWSLRRELWENRSLYIAPVVVAVFAFIAFTISTIGMPARRRNTLTLDPASQRAAVGAPYVVVSVILLVAAFIVGIFYCLDALYGERRDRSILFWKSLPLSDVTAVLAKASIPMLVLPAITFVITVLTQFIMLLWSTLVLLPSGQAGTTWTRFPLPERSLFLLYGLVVIALWHAPLYAWFLFLSAWARRAVFLWAFLPVFVLAIFEKIALHTTYVGTFLRNRLVGFDKAFAFGPHGRLDSFSQLTPGTFLTTPGLWLGLIFAALCLAAAVQLRRSREPI